MTGSSKKEILKVIVGSQAHGLARPDSDFDYRGVFVVPTSDILKLGGTIQHTSWIEGKEDDTSWEIGKFLQMSVKSNPTVLETYLAPRVGLDVEKPYDWGLGTELRELFPYVWSSKGVRDSFIGYGLNQRKKFLEDKDHRAWKYATAYLRTLFQAYELLYTNNKFSVDFRGTAIYGLLQEIRDGKKSIGFVIDLCKRWEASVEAAYVANPNKEVDMDKINEFLLKVRKTSW